MFANRQQLSSPSPRASFQPQLTRHLLAASLLATSVAAGCDHTDDTPNHRSATGTIDPATGGTSIGEFEPIERADFFCPYRYTPTSDDATASTLPIPYCASATLDGRTRYDFDAVSRLVISQHGRGSDAQMYFDRMNDAAVALGPELPGATFVIAPQFFDTNPIKNNKVEESDLAGILWWKDGGWPSGFSSNGHQGASLSSFTVMDGRLLLCPRSTYLKNELKRRFDGKGLTAESPGPLRSRGLALPDRVQSVVMLDLADQVASLIAFFPMATLLLPDLPFGPEHLPSAAEVKRAFPPVFGYSQATSKGTLHHYQSALGLEAMLAGLKLYAKTQGSMGDLRAMLPF